MKKRRRSHHSILAERKAPNHIEGIVSDYDPNHLVRFLMSADTQESKREWMKHLNEMIEGMGFRYLFICVLISSSIASMKTPE